MNAATVRYWTWSVSGAALCFVLIAGILVAEAKADLRPSETSPANGSTDVSTLPTLRVRYRQALDPASARATFRLEPAVAGELDVDERELTFRPARPLAPESTYAIVLGAGLRDRRGKEAQYDVRVTFRTRSTGLVAFRSDGSAWGIWTLDPVAETERQLVRIPMSPETLTHPPAAAASPDGNEVAYVAPAPEGRWSLWAVETTTQQTRQILGDQDGIVASLNWSPRGDLLAYEHNLTYGGIVQSPKIRAVTADGSQTALLYGRSDESGSHPVWSPDGRRLAFYEQRLRALVIFSFGTALQSVRSDLAQPVAWSSDGRSLAYMDRAPTGAGASTVKVAHLDPTGVTVQEHEPDMLADGYPAWSPDGAWLSVIRLSGPESSVWLRQTQDGLELPIPSEPGWSYLRALWSPDSMDLAYNGIPLRASRATEEPPIWIASRDGTVRRLARGGALVSWSP